MPENAPRRKHQLHGGVPLRKGLVRKEEAAPPTPAPSWKLYENPSFHVVAAVAMAAATGLMECEEEQEDEDNEEDNEQLEGNTASTWKHEVFQGIPTRLQEGPALCLSFLSARKLAAALRDEFQEEVQHDSTDAMCDFREPSPCSHLQPRASSLSNSESPDSVTHHNSLKKDLLEDHGGLLDEYNADAGPRASPCGYMKAFSRFSLESTKQDESTCSEKHSWALSRVHQVEAAQISACVEVDSLLKRCADDIIMLQREEQEKVQAAILLMAEKLEVEREARKNAEMESKRLANCVVDANKVVVATEKELEKERKSRQLMEDVCNELAKEIGEEKTEVEALKKELAKARDEIEEERKVLRVTEAWREERVQMKLAEAKLELEERCVALDRLKMELESALSKQRVHRTGRGGKSLERAIMNRLQEETSKLQEGTSKSAFFQEDARFLFSSDDNLLSSNISSSRPNSWSNKDGRSSLIRQAYNRKYKRSTVFSSECNGKDSDWNGNTDKFARESTNAQLHEQRSRHCKQASSWRRREASMRSYRSKIKGLSTLGGRDFVENCTDELDRNRCSIEDIGSHGGSSSDCKFSEQDEEETNGTGLQGERGVLLWSSNGEELEISACEEQKVDNKESRHGAARMMQRRYCGQAAAGVERHYYGVSHDYMLAAESVSAFPSIARPSPAFKGHMPSPDLPARRPFHTGSPDKQSALLARRAVHSSVNWVKPYKRNSLQAKLLLEDKLLR